MAQSLIGPAAKTGTERDLDPHALQLRVLGPLEAVRGEESLHLGGPKQRALLGLLIVAAPNAVSAELLIEGLWGESASEGSRSTLQTYVSNLRQALGTVLVHHRGAYRLSVDPSAIDAVRFSTTLGAARERVVTEPEETAAALQRALAWWRGRPFADLLDVAALEPESRRLEALRLEAVELRLDAELARGRHAELIAELEALAEEHPTRERFRAQHMLALYRSGRQADALRAYRRTEAYLLDELGVDPSDELQELELKILEHDHSLLTGIGRLVTQRLAFLVSDIEGSTRLWDRFPRLMPAALAKHDRILYEEVEKAGGRVFKHTGDGVLAVLPDAVAAVNAAEGILTRLRDVEWGEIGELLVRIGVDAGEAQARGNDFFGPPLNRAARLCAIGHGGQVLVSAAAEREVTSSAPAGLQVRHLGEVHLRGMAVPERVAQMVFVGLPADFPELRFEAGLSLEERSRMMSLPGYEVRERIGEGAFGQVWRAYQPSVGREVAVKIIRPELASRPEFIRRFEAEARTIGRLAHPHIVPLIDFWRDADSAFLVLALLPGGSLSRAMEEGEVDRGVARRIVRQIGAALDHAHAHHITHGDLKPANILLDGFGNAYLSDFGIAARLVPSSSTPPTSSAPLYRAPEEADAGPSPAADRYALGMLARELLAGHPEILPVVSRATASNPSDRYPSCAAFLSDLDEVLGEEDEGLQAPVVSRNPYKGLRAFDEADAADFRGRDELVATLLAAVSDRRFVAVVGPSGSGKSSVVRAGLLPVLAGAVEPRLLPVVFTPGPDPIESLLRSLGALGRVDESDLADRLRSWSERLKVDGELLLVIDQFEEVYTLVEDPEQRKVFLDLLVSLVTEPGRIRALVTLRADFYDRPLADGEVGRLVRDGQVTVLPPSRGELIEMIGTPAQAVGLRWEPGLPHRIAEDVVSRAGALPLLQYALTELVERRSGDLLTGSDYTRIGEVSGALAGRAESVYRGLTARQQEVARQVLLRLVTVDEDTDDARRRVRRSELESLDVDRADLAHVLEVFVSERLLLADHDPVTRGPTIEVAHEALLREWPRLETWIDDQREALILGRRFRAALDEWEGSGRHPDYLLTGSRLAPFRGWAERASLTPEEREYYKASRLEDQAVRTARRRRRRMLGTILVTAAVVALALGGIAAVQARRAGTEAEAANAAERQAEEEADAARRAAARAEDEARRARANELSAFATAALEFDPTLAKLLAVTSARTAEPSVDTISVLHQAFAADPVVDRYLWPEDREVGFLWTSLSPDGSRLVAAGCGCDLPSTYLEVVDLERDEVLWAFDDVEDPSIIVDSPLFSPDGETVAAGLYWYGETEASSGPLGAHVWDAETGELLQHFDLGRCGGSVLAITHAHIVADSVVTPDGACFYPNMAAPQVILIEIATGSRRVLTGSGGFVAMSGDGRFVAYGDRTVEPWRTVVEDLTTGERILDAEVSEPSERTRALNHDGSLLVLSYRDRLEAQEVSSGETVSTFYGHPAGVWSVTFSSAGDDSVFSTGGAGGLIHWDAATGREIASFPAVGNGNVSMAQTGLVAVADQTARTTSLIATWPRGEEWATEAASCSGFVAAATTRVGGAHAGFGEICADGRLNNVVVGVDDGEVVAVVPGGRWQASAISPDGSRLARVDAGDGPVDSGQEEWFGPPRIRDALSGEVVVELQGVCTWDMSLARAGQDPASQAGCEAYPETPFPVFPDDVLWSPDGDRVAVWSLDLLLVWDARTGELLSGYQACVRPRGVLFDGEEFIVYCDEGDRARLAFVDAASGAETRSVDIERFGTDVLGFAGRTPDASHLVAVRGFQGVGGGSLVWIDTETFEVSTLPRIHDGAPKSYALSPTNRLLATGSADGFVKVWDVVERRQVHEIRVGDTQVQGLAFIGEAHLMVVTQDGLVAVYTLDVDELIQTVVESATRGFTETECERYGFADCPTLSDLRSRQGT